MDLALLLFLILINGILAMSEIAVVTSRKARLQRLADDGSPGARSALSLHAEPSGFLSTIQIGITTIGILSGAIGEASLADPLAAWLSGVPAIAPYAKGIAMTIVVAGLTYTAVVVGELVLGDYLDSLRRLLALDVERIFPAHGPAIENPKAKIEEYLAHRALRDAQVMAALEAGLTRTMDIVRRIYTDIPEYLHGAAGVSVEAHLRRFGKTGRVTRDGEHWILG